MKATSHSQGLLHWLAYNLSRWLLKAIFLIVARIHVWKSGGALPKSPFLLAANHISHFDPPLLTAVTSPKIDWIAMMELFAHPLAAAYFRAVDTFPTDRSKADRESVRVALNRLKRGHVVGVFPEGGIRDGEASLLAGAPLKPGVAALAQMANVPVVPCVILGSDRLYDAKKWIPFRRVPIWIAFGEPLRIDPALPRPEARERLHAEVGESLRRIFKQMQERFALQPDDLPKPPKLRQEGA